MRTLAGSPERIPSPINVAEMRSSDPPARPGLRRRLRGHPPAVRRGLVRRGRRLRAREPGGDRARRAATSRGPGRCSTRRPNGSRQTGDERGRADVLVRRAYLELAEGSVREARACLERALLLRRQLNDRRGVGLVLSGLGLIDTAAGELRERRAAPRRGPRDLPARRRPLGAREHALADGRPRPRARPSRRRGGGAAGGAGGARRDAARTLDRAHDRRTGRGGGCSGATPSGRRRCSPTPASATPRRTTSWASPPSTSGSTHLLRRR